jgi:hypothetical protein
MKTLSSDREARCLLPEQEDRFFVVLFWSDADVERIEAINRFLGMQWPPGWISATLDIAAAPETAAWFGVLETPTLAVIRDGALLAVASECDDGVCHRLLQWAHSCHRRFDSL